MAKQNTVFKDAFNRCVKLLEQTASLPSEPELGATLGVFVVTGLLAAFIMLVIVRVFPPVLTPWTDAAAGTVDDPAPLATLLVNFFTVEDFAALFGGDAAVVDGFFGEAAELGDEFLGVELDVAEDVGDGVSLDFVGVNGFAFLKVDADDVGVT